MSGPGIHPYHHRHHHHQQQWPPAPPPVPHPVESPSRTPPEKVHTIFINGLPEDVKERKLQNLLRWLPGYEASQVNFKREQPMGFALFTNAHFALSAREALQEMVLDAESKSVLHTEMAKKNLFVKREMGCFTVWRRGNIKNKSHRPAGCIKPRPQESTTKYHYYIISTA